MSVASRRRPLDLYHALLGTVPGAGETARVRALRVLLAGPEEAWPPALRERIDAAGVSTAYLTRGLLSIHRFAPEVRGALEAGLPFAVARLVNNLASAAARRRALAPLAAPDWTGGRLLPRGVAANVERRARAEAARAREGASGADASVDERGWVSAATPAVAARRMRGDVWAFEPPGGARAREEPLAERVVEAVLARTLPQGGELVDVTAGRGTIARVARRHAVRSWSGDVEPRAPFVHRADARTLLLDRPPGIAPACADLLVVHPPSYPVWVRATEAEGGVEAYQDALGEMLAGSLGVVRPGGAVVMVARPVRERGMVSVATSYLADAFALSDVVLEAYVVAVSVERSEDWHLLVGRVRREPRRRAGEVTGRTTRDRSGRGA